MRTAVGLVGGLLICALVSFSPVAADVVVGDAVDQLLFGDSPPMTEEAPTSDEATQATAPRAASADSHSATAVPQSFHHEVTLPAPADSRLGADRDLAAHATQMESEHKDATGPFTAVPEPSAIFLAVAALVYFLLFGRRRRVV